MITSLFEVTETATGYKPTFMLGAMLFLDVDNSYKNFDYCGGWLAKSPLARQKLADRGFRDLQSALLKQSLKKK